ncbi:MAG: hypothetical protein ABI910_03620 [Gemmatimonadota bacterium]
MPPPPAGTWRESDRSRSIRDPALGIVTADGHLCFYRTRRNVIPIADFVYGANENLGYLPLTTRVTGQTVTDAVE